MNLSDFILLAIFLVISISMLNSIINSSFAKDENTNTNTSNRPNDQLSKNFYKIEEVCPELKNIYDDLQEIQLEVKNVRDKTWSDWPEKDLYETNKTNKTKSTIFKQTNQKPRWDIYPFTAFDVTVKRNCDSCPKLWKFLKSIPGLKVALLSRLGPGTKLTSHQGWGSHSNHVIRCHFGIDVPRGCYISVRNTLDDDEEIKLHKQDNWLLFDDSRYHYAHNPTDKERIVLILDITRPPNIKTGTSEVGDTKELLQIVDYYKQIKINKNK